ncbi:aminoglycoside phosphotransferase family protein [Streptoalloteichus hindustanus]|uniref:Hygromycin-B 7''-O-kinase n=1 Tax=Streptoalloteichus hindustanus TaxID=2017 RepID=A0A1M5EJ78_STRHI|nr:aminoglycoside 3'-phosphotransferase/choline kinase family protein [Streptoalloteichus hindustanus]SHF79318.1 hygromycin-B 7''-O-kinase [Streptoalloteichus hindustanus]
MPAETLLPAADTVERYDAVRSDESLLLPGVTALCDRLGLLGATLERFEDGSLPVYAVGGNQVLKLYPAVHRHEADVESGVLRAVEGRLPVPTPRVDAVGEFEGWGYVLMERLRGESLTSVWPRTSPRQRDRLAAELGAALAALHAVEDPVLDRLEPADWGRFLAEQRAGCVDRQRRAGLGAPWLEQIPAFLNAVPLDPSPRPVLLHTEVMSDHLLVTPTDDGWALSGLFDFEPAMRGANEYEFVAVGLFVARGDAVVLRRVLTSYGFAADALDEELSRRFLAYTLLHVYSNLPWYLREMPKPPESSLDALATAWWGLD